MSMSIFCQFSSLTYQYIGKKKNKNIKQRIFQRKYLKNHMSDIWLKFENEVYFAFLSAIDLL